MKTMLLAATVAATSFTTNAMASSTRPSCSSIDSFAILQLCEGQQDIYDAIKEGEEANSLILGNKIEDLESKIDELEREIETSKP